jgi:hypothetical protein
LTFIEVSEECAAYTFMVASGGTEKEHNILEKKRKKEKKERSKERKKG